MSLWRQVLRCDFICREEPFSISLTAVLDTSMKRSKLILMCVLAVVVVIPAGLYVYRRSTTKPKCNCMFPNTRKYGVIGFGGGCRVVDCEVPQAAKQAALPAASR